MASTTIVIHLVWLVISFGSNHLASWSHSLLLVMLLDGLDILILLLYLLMNITLVILSTASHYLFRYGGSLNEVSFQEKLGSLQGISKGSLGIFAIEYISEFI